MIEKIKALSGMLVYLGSGLSALFIAAWFSTQFVGKAMSQTSLAEMTAVTGASQSAPSAGAATAAAVAGAASAQLAHRPAGTDGAIINAPTSATAHATPGTLTLSPAPGSKPDLTKPVSLAEIIEDYTYNPTGKRDPFAPYELPSESVAMGPLWPLQRFDLEQLKLIGIIWDVREPKAMILDPSGKGYVVKVNERIGRNNGYVARIREGEIIIVESYTAPDGKLNYSTKLMKLRTD